MGELGLTRAQWCKSIYSSANGACVEAAQNLPEIVAIRDPKSPDDPKLLISPADWKMFLRRARRLLAVPQIFGPQRFGHSRGEHIVFVIIQFSLLVSSIHFIEGSWDVWFRIALGGSG